MEHSTEKIVKNTLLFTGALVMQKIISFAYFLYLSSRLSPDLLGSYIWALSYTTVFSIGMDLGLSSILTREAAKTPQKSEEYLKNILAIKIPLIFITLFVAFLVLFLTKSDAQIRFLVLGASAVMVFDALSLAYYSFLRARQNVGFESLGIIGFQLITLATGVILLETTGKIVYVMSGLALASFINFLYSLFITKLKFGYSVAPVFNKETIKIFLKLIPAFALSGIFIKIYNAADSVILGYLKNNAAVGLFSVPAKVVTAFQALIPGAFAATIYPSMSNFYISSKEKLRDLFEKSFQILTLISIPLALGLYLTARPIINLIWPKYNEVILTFQIMSLTLPFVFLAFPTGLLLRACDRQTTNTFNRGLIALLSIILNIILIPLWGILGAGLAYLFTNVLLLVLDFVFIKKIIDYRSKNIIIYSLKTALAGLIMTAAVYLTLFFSSLYAAIAVGIIVFLILAFSFRMIKKDEILFFKKIFSKKNDEPR